MIELIDIKIEVPTLASLIAGLYCLNASVDPVAIPVSLYLELAEKLLPYLETWDYSKISFEDWLRTSLLIAPKIVFGEEDLKEFQSNEIYFERENGNVILICTAGMMQ